MYVSGVEESKLNCRKKGYQWNGNMELEMPQRTLNLKYSTKILLKGVLAGRNSWKSERLKNHNL